MPSFFSGVLQCGVCGGALVVVSGHPRRRQRRYGCGFHREKGSRVCPNHLTVKVATGGSPR
ncbi:MAG: recombinase zinc beta ribbon domain-containing protein [Candidatus Rokubacteria bacterium]|nr:recombinase zinc beta ribbon domain-containing protein [Candidatus Rokubacteria bacterium]